MSSPLSTAPDRPLPAPARPEAVVEGPGYRFTVLTSRLIRMEHLAVPGGFTDAATQLVTSRDLGPVPDFRVRRTGSGEGERVEVVTEHLHLTYRPFRGFSRTGLQVALRTRVIHPHGGTWRFGDTWDPREPYPTNLGGTARTLDEADGAVPLCPGLLSLAGWAVLDDSASLLLTEDQWVRPRPGASPVDGSTPDTDLYLFGYGQDYRAALGDFFRLTGPTPLIDRALLGNWWSRYHAYSEEEYLALVDRFAAEGVPLSVAVVDMDWHEVDVDPAIGNGWTGYTWNRRLFPDPGRFLAALHGRGLEVALNLHPADGIRRHEAAYRAVAARLGLDPDTGTGIPFNIGDRAFTDAYLTCVHHPLEEQGVDFWWLDWQQGGATDVPGLDPLWMLNHVHYLDSGRERPRGPGSGARPAVPARQEAPPPAEAPTESPAPREEASPPAGSGAEAPTGSPAPGESATGGGPGAWRRRPVTFSRFADASSHRTPVGFSGDTYATWASLAFQPEFTATAANIGYYWWSHDIGGHMLGTADPERSARWVQLGCFSPVNRLHSTRSAFSSKEPWRYSRDARATMEAYLRLRHRLVPTLYTWARRAHSQGVGPVRPLYHDHPRQPGAYRHRTTFLFGDLLVVPMVHPLDAVTRLGREDAWLPRGTWWDVVTGRRYEVLPEGGRELSFFRPLERLPVLAREGCVLVLAGDLSEAAGSNPVHLALVLVPGAPGTRGEFVLEEDDGSPEPGDDAVTRTTLTASWSAEGVRLSVREQGAEGVVPSRRRLRLEILGVSAPGAAQVRLDGRPLDVPTAARQADGTTLGGGLSVDLGVVDATARRRGTTVEVGGLAVRQAPWQEEVLALLEEARIEYAVKDTAWAAVGSGLTGAALLASLRAAGLGEGLLGAVTEVL